MLVSTYINYQLKTCETVVEKLSFVCLQLHFFGFVAMIAGEDRANSATDLARAWEAVPDLRRRGQVLQLVSKRSDSCNSPIERCF